MAGRGTLCLGLRAGMSPLCPLRPKEAAMPSWGSISWATQ